MNQFKSAIRKAGLRQTTMSVRLVEVLNELSGASHGLHEIFPEVAAHAEARCLNRFLGGPAGLLFLDISELSSGYLSLTFGPVWEQDVGGKVHHVNLDARLDVGLPGRLGSGPLGAANYELVPWLGAVVGWSVLGSEQGAAPEKLDPARRTLGMRFGLSTPEIKALRARTLSFGAETQRTWIQLRDEVHGGDRRSSHGAFSANVTLHLDEHTGLAFSYRAGRHAPLLVADRTWELGVTLTG